MTKRSPGTVFILSLVTLGIYAIIWIVKTKREMVKCGADIPTSWLMIVPIVSLFYMWKWSGGVEHVTQGKSSQAVTFIILLILSQVFLISVPIIQSQLNQAIDRGIPGQLPAARVA